MFHISSVAESLAKVMSVALFILTFTCTIVIAFNFLVVELAETVNVEMIIALTDIGVMIGITFAHFYLAEWVTTDLFDIGDLFYNSAWYCLPVKRQKLLTLPIQRASREFRLRGLDVFDCSLPAFSAVQKKRIQKFCNLEARKPTFLLFLFL